MFGQTKKWTLQECVSQALSNHLQIQNVYLSAENAAIDEKTAIASRYPNLSSASNVGWNFGRSIDPTTNTFINQTFFNNGLSLNSSVVLFNGNKLNNLVAQSRSNNLAAKEDLRQRQRDVALEIASFYLNVLFAKENLANTNIQKAQVIDQLEQLNKLIRAGSRPANDTLDLIAQLAANERSIIDASNTLELSLLTLKQAIRLDWSVPFDIESISELKLNLDPEILTYEGLYDIAVQNQPSVEAARIRMKSAELSTKIAEADKYPSLAGFGGLRSNYSNRGFRLGETQIVKVDIPVEINGQAIDIRFPQEFRSFEKANYPQQLNDNLSLFVGFNLNIPIYSNNQIQSSIQKSILSQKQAALAYETTIDALRINIGRALQDATAAKASFQAATRSYEAQKNAYENSRQRFEIGLIPSFEMLRVKNLLDIAQTNQLIAKYQYIFTTKVLEFYLNNNLDF